MRCSTRLTGHLMATLPGMSSVHICSLNMQKKKIPTRGKTWKNCEKHLFWPRFHEWNSGESLLVIGCSVNYIKKAHFNFENTAL